MTTRYVLSGDGVRLAVHESGDSRAPVVVAVHGFPDNHAVWDGVAAALGESVRLVAYDVRGSGGSDKPAGRSAYRMERLADDLAAVIDAVSPEEPVHLLGHDWGSIQLWGALAEPRIAGRAASFTSISGPSLDHAAVWLRDVRHPLASARQLLSSTYIAAFQVPRLPEAVLRRAPLERVTGRAFERSEADRTNPVNLYRANVSGRLLRPQPRPLDLPVLVLAPREDPYVRLPLATGAPVPFVRDLTVEEVPGGHWVVTDDPALVADRVLAFVERHTVRAG
jgi:pimeloyl-ACP methyl ester carboxylesterase